jgi:hypothetical protein
VKISGGFFGIDSAVIDHGLAKVRSLQPRIDSIVTLSTRGSNSHAALRLLGAVGTKALDYYLRTTPPLLALPAAVAFDAVIRKARMDCLQLDLHADPGSPSLITSRAHALAEMPLNHGGFGHMSAATLAASAFIASVRAAQHDHILAERSSQLALLRFTSHAYDLVGADLGRPMNAFPAIAKLVPVTAAALANAPASPSTRLTKTTAKKIQSVIMCSVFAEKRLALRTECHPARTARDGNDRLDLSPSAACHLHLVTSRSQQSRMFKGSLWFDSNFVEHNACVNFCRYYLGLLPLLRPWCPPVARFPSPGRLNTCASGHSEPTLLEPDGSHCISCPACFALRHAAHERINKVYAKFARLAGCEVDYNPSTNLMMANQYGDYARMLYPKKPTPDRIRLAAALKLATMHAATSKDPLVREAAAKQVAILVGQCPIKLEGLRVDCIIRTSLRTLWLDIGIVHPTAKSRLALVAAFLERVFRAEADAAGSLPLNIMAQVASPAVVAYGDVKNKRYAPAIKDATAQVKDGLRSSAPVFVPCIFSHAGEMSPESLRVVELITREYARTTALVPHEDGIAMNRRTAEFRCRFKDALAVANANGFGSTLSHAGKPRAGRFVAAADANGGLPLWEMAAY